MAYTPDQFAALLMDAATRAPREAVAVVRKGLKNVKNDARRNSIASSGFSAKGAPFKIEYDGPHADGVILWGEVGYEGSGQGKLGVLLEYGGGGDASPPHRDLGRALEVEEPRFERAIGDMGERLLEG